MSDKPDKEKKFKSRVIAAIEKTLNKGTKFKPEDKDWKKAAGVFVPDLFKQLCQEVSQEAGQEKKTVRDGMTAMLLSQMVYWTDRGAKPGVFWKSGKEWNEEIGILRHQLRISTEKIENAGFIHEILSARIKGAPTRHYKFDEKFFGTIIKEMLRGTPHTLTSLQDHPEAIRKKKEREERKKGGLSQNQPMLKSAKEEDGLSRNQHRPKPKSANLYTETISERTKNTETTAKSKTDIAEDVFLGDTIRKEKSKAKSPSGSTKSFAPTRKVKPKQFREEWKKTIHKYYPGRPTSLTAEEQGMVQGRKGSGYLKFCRENKIDPILLMQWAVMNWSYLKTKILWNTPSKTPKPKLMSNPTVLELCAKKGEILTAYHEQPIELAAAAKIKREAKKFWKGYKGEPLIAPEEKRQADRIKNDPYYDGY